MRKILELNGNKVDLNGCSHGQLVRIIEYLAQYAKIPNNKPKKQLGNIEQSFLEEKMKFDNEECEERWYQHLDYPH